MINPEYLRYFAIGDVYNLNLEFDSTNLANLCDTFNFTPRGKNLESISLTSLDGTLTTAVEKGLKYIDGIKDFDFRTPTEYFDKVSQFMPFLNETRNIIGRTRIFKGLPCGVWEPHRDGSYVIRLVIPIKNCNKKNFHFIYEDKVLSLSDGTVYAINTLKEHSAVVYSSTIYMMVLCLTLSVETEKFLTKYLQIK